jgi:hypothetical protein
MEKIEGKRAAVLAALEEVSGYGTGSSPAEIADAALDKLVEETVYLEPEDFFAVEAEVTREVYAVLEFDGGASDATFVSQETLETAIARAR